MANWAKPTVSSQYLDLVNEVNAKFEDLAKAFPSEGEFLSLPEGSISFRSNKWQRNVAGSWVDLATTYSISISGTASNITGNLAVNRGGTGQTSYTVGDLLYATGATSLGRLTAVSTGNVLRSGGVAGAPTWGKVSLVTDVEGTLSVSRGGTGAVTISGLLKGNGTNPITAAEPGVDYAAANHTHNYLDATGGTLTGNLSIASGALERRLTLGNSGIYIYGNPGGVGFFKSGVISFNIDSTTGLVSVDKGITSGGSISCTGLTSSGTITASGNITSTSDKRLKSNINTIDSALTKVNKLRGVEYTMKGVRSLGVIAQELQKVIPELVHEDSSGHLSVAYGNLVGLLIEAVKELDRKVTNA